MSRISDMSHGSPQRWVGTTAAVRAVMARSKLRGVMLNVTGSTSAKTGLRPQTRAISGITQNVSAGKMISLPFGRSSA